jgi:hypothetical protein
MSLLDFHCQSGLTDRLAVWERRLFEGVPLLRDLRGPFRIPRYQDGIAHLAACGSLPTRPLQNRPRPRQSPHRHQPKSGARTTTGLVRRVYEEGRPCRIKRRCAACVPLVATTRQRHRRIVSDENPDLCEWRNRMATPEEAVWNALLEMEPSLTRMEEPDVPSLTAKFFDELRVRGFVLVAVADLEAASRAIAKYVTKPKLD